MTKQSTNNWLELMAQKLAEVRLSEVGFRFVHGIYPAWRRVKQVFEVKAHIVQRDSLYQKHIAPEDKLVNTMMSTIKEFEERAIKK